LAPVSEWKEHNPLKRSAYTIPHEFVPPRKVDEIIFFDFGATVYPFHLMSASNFLSTGFEGMPDRKKQDTASPALRFYKK